MYRILLLILIIVTTASAESSKHQIGIILPYTGVYQEYAKECEEGFQLARSESSELLKERVEFLTEDDLSTPKAAVNAFQKLLQHKNLLAVSLFSSSNVLAATSLSVSNKVTLLGLSGHPDFLKNNPYGISCWQDTEAETKAFLNWLITNKIKKLGIISFENDYPLAVRKYLEAWAPKEGIEITFNELVHDQGDYRSLLVKLKNNPPEVLFLNLLGSTFPNIVRQLHESGYQGTKLALHANARSDYLKAAGSDAAEGIIFYGPDYHHQYFLRHFPPERDTAQGLAYVYSCYQGMKLLLSQVEELIATNNLSRAALHEKLKVIDHFMIGAEKIPVVDRRVGFGFTKSRSSQGKIIHIPND